MKIGYDGKRAVCNMTGLGNYSRLVIKSIAEEYGSDECCIYSPQMRDNDRLAELKLLPNVSWYTPDSHNGLAQALWRTRGITRTLQNDNITLFHGLSNELPLNIGNSPIASVVTIHDVIYRRMPQCYALADRLIYDYKYGQSCRIADRVIAISECTKRDVMELYGVSEDKIDIVYQGCSEIFRERVSDEKKTQIKKLYQLPAKYIIQVGTIELRKNLELGIKALTSIPEDIHLVAVGKGKSYKKRVLKLSEELGVAKRVHFLENIPFADLPALYQMSLAVLYPSRYEGFGIPVLEGLTSRRPVITSNVSCLPEAGGDAAFYVSPDNPRQVAEIINAIDTGEADVESAVARGIKHIKRFDNSRMASNIHAVYEKTLALKY
jgi:glycosyltransferase involved in cell wall biosynthesis